MIIAFDISTPLKGELSAIIRGLPLFGAPLIFGVGKLSVFFIGQAILVSGKGFEFSFFMDQFVMHGTKLNAHFDASPNHLTAQTIIKSRLSRSCILFEQTASSSWLSTLLAYEE